MLTAHNIVKSYGDLTVLKGISLEVNRSEVISITGKSGAGKSTLLHILGTLDNPDSGEISINGKNPFTLRQKSLAKFRNEHIGFVFQFHHLLPEFTAIDNVMIPAFIKGSDRKNSLKRAQELLDYLGILERSEHKPSELSGGEQQRVAFARALMNKPSIIFADEPSGNLDSQTSQDLHQLIFDLRDEFNQTFILVTHNKVLTEMCDRTINLIDGTIPE